VRALQNCIATRLQHKISKARFKADEAIGKLPLCVECPYNSDNQPGHPDNGKGVCGDAACWSAKLDGVVQAKRETAEAEGEPLVAIHDGYWSNDGVIGKQDYEVVRSQDAEAKKAKRAIVVEGDDRGKLAWIVKKGSAAPGAKKPDTPEDIQRKAEERENRAINAARKDALRDISITLYNSDPKVVTGKVQQALMAQLAEGMFHSDFTMVERDAAAARHELVKPDEKGRFKVKQGEGDTLLSRHLKGLEPDQLLGFCVEAIIQRYVKGSPWGQPDRLANVGKLLGVNVKDYEKAALAELKEKTDAKAARAEAKRAKELAQVGRQGQGQGQGRQDRQAQGHQGQGTQGQDGGEVHQGQVEVQGQGQVVVEGSALSRGPAAPSLRRGGCWSIGLGASALVCRRPLSWPAAAAGGVGPGVRALVGIGADWSPTPARREGRAVEDMMPNYSDGKRNRLSDIRCGWRKAQDFEREQFARDLMADDESRQLLDRVRREWDDAQADGRRSRKGA
jgi:hypothetical protein